MEYQSPLICIKFQSKFQNLKNEIEQYLINRNYDLPEGLEIDNLIGWNNFEEETKIYLNNDKCPSEIIDGLLVLIKREFPKQSSYI